MTPTQEDQLIEPYRTSDTPFAAFLHLNGFNVVGTRQDPNDYKREVLYFVDTQEVHELEQLWRFGKASGDLKKFHRSLKIINRTVNEARKQREL